MPWLFVSPGHQLPRVYLYEIGFSCLTLEWVESISDSWHNLICSYRQSANISRPLVCYITVGAAPTTLITCRATLIFKMQKNCIKQINCTHIDIFQKKGCRFKIRMEFLRTILVEIELICQQPAMTRPTGVIGVIVYPFPNFKGIHSQSSTVKPSTFGNGSVIKPPTYWACDCLSTLRLKLPHINKRGPGFMYWPLVLATHSLYTFQWQIKSLSYNENLICSNVSLIHADPTADRIRQITNSIGPYSLVAEIISNHILLPSFWVYFLLLLLKHSCHHICILTMRWFIIPWILSLPEGVLIGAYHYKYGKLVITIIIIIIVITIIVVVIIIIAVVVIVIYHNNYYYYNYLYF